MASHYDPAKKCRVGTMDESQFQKECDEPNGAYFQDLMAAWKKAGGELKWGAGGVGLRGEIEGKLTGVCFLAPKFASKKDRIELACATLAKQIGKDNCSQLQEAIRNAAGGNVLGTSMISVIQPGLLAAAKRKALTKVFIDLL